MDQQAWALSRKTDTDSQASQPGGCSGPQLGDETSNRLVRAGVREASPVPSWLFTAQCVMQVRRGVGGGVGCTAHRGCDGVPVVCAARGGECADLRRCRLGVGVGVRVGVEGLGLEG